MFWAQEQNNLVVWVWISWTYSSWQDKKWFQLCDLRRSASAYNNFIWSYIDSGGIRTQNSSCDKRQHFFCASHIVSK